MGQLAVSVGSSKITGGTFYMIEVLKIHPEYSVDGETRNNDIAIVKLKKSVVFSSTVSSICLPTTNDASVVYNKNVVVSGW